jgi:peptide/nickel transport system substrate-binding protein
MAWPGKSKAGVAKPGKGCLVRFATRSDTIGLDPHRNILYYVSDPLALTTQGLLDLNPKLEPSPGIATSWEGSKDLLTYTFKLRKGALYHNGREIDAASVKWNYERILDPKIGHSFTRSALGNIKEVLAPDKYTVVCKLQQPSAAFPSDVVFYPANLMAPGTEEQANTHPIGCGPFKFKRWERHNVTELERFENYFETDAEGNPLPYIAEVEGRPKKVDQVRLTALRTGQVDLIDNMAYADAESFPKKYEGTFQTWKVPALGTAYIIFNLEKGPFSNKTPAGKMLRQAAAYATDLDAIHHAVFYQQGDIATGYFTANSPWYASAEGWKGKYDPDKAKYLLKKAGYSPSDVIVLMSMMPSPTCNKRVSCYRRCGPRWASRSTTVFSTMPSCAKSARMVPSTRSRRVAVTALTPMAGSHAKSSRLHLPHSNRHATATRRWTNLFSKLSRPWTPRNAWRSITTLKPL